MVLVSVWVDLVSKSFIRLVQAFKFDGGIGNFPIVDDRTSHMSIEPEFGKDLLPYLCIYLSALFFCE